MGVVSLSATETSAASIQFQSPLLGAVFLATRGGAFSISTRTQICFPYRRRRPLLSVRVKSVESSSTVHELQDFRVVPSDVLTAEKEEAKAVLTMFLKNEIGLSNEAAAATISKSVPFIDHFIARLHSFHITRYPVGRELTTLEISDALIPYLENLCEEHEDSFVDVMENFPNPSDEECKDHRDSLYDAVENFPNPPKEERKRHISEASPSNLLFNSKKSRAIAQMTEIGTDGQLHPNTLYLLDIGLDMNQIKTMASKYVSITGLAWGRKTRHLVEFLLDLGLPPSDIPKILYKSPNLCNFRLSENMAYLETLGLDKSKWVTVIKRFPNLLICSKQKVKAAVDYFYELGLSRDIIGKILTRSPQIIGSNVDDNLRLKAEYFLSMGVNLTTLLNRYPQVLSLSMECKLKPVTEFLLDKGFSIDEIGIMASKFGSMYCLSLTDNLIPKWDFFLTMDYPRATLVKYPNYFGYSLEGRTKPRYAQMKACGVKLPMGKFLFSPDFGFLVLLNRMKAKKMLKAQQDSMAVTFDEDLEPDV